MHQIKKENSIARSVRIRANARDLDCEIIWKMFSIADKTPEHLYGSAMLQGEGVTVAPGRILFSPPGSSCAPF